MADKGRETLETRAREYLRRLGLSNDIHAFTGTEDITTSQILAEFARTVAREMIAELRNEADRREAHWRGEIPTYDHGRIRGLRDAAENFESSPRYGAGSSKVKPGEPTQ